MIEGRHCWNAHVTRNIEDTIDDFKARAVMLERGCDAPNFLYLDGREFLQTLAAVRRSVGSLASRAGS